MCDLLKLFSIFMIFAKTSGFLLPNIAVPFHYDLNLNVELDPKFQFNGTVYIHINVLNETKSLYFHSNELILDETQSYVTNGTGYVKVQSFKVNEVYNIVNATTTDRISTGWYILVIKFNGKYSKFIEGLFMDYYINKQGEKRYILGTHFQPARARLMFPCFDEPNLKATFTLNVTHPSDYHAISNAEINSKRNYGAKTLTSFKKTPKMSTYLLALSVSDFVTFSNYTAPVTNTSITLYVEPEEIQNSKFAINITVSSVTYLQNLLGVNYSLTKLDGISIPEFDQGMENWGLIIYGSSVLLNGTTASTERMFFNTFLIAHEVAHQWFGNLVTLNWWDYVWLNEGFASYYAHRIADKINPEYRFMYNHIVDMQTILEQDANFGSRSLNDPVANPHDALYKFSPTSYLKGSAIVRFMSLIFQNYDTAITEYLKENAYKNVVPEDLYNAFSKGNTGLPRGANVHSIMKGWTENAGYPLVTVNVTSNNNGMAIIAISQKRFFTKHETIMSSEKWWIPITLSSEAEPNFDQIRPIAWLRDQDESIVLPMPNHSGWLLANIQQAVFCRINYDDDNWRKIIKYLKGPNFTDIHVLNRAQLIGDAGAFGNIGLLNQSLVLDLFSYLKQEQDDIPHKVVSYGFSNYLKILKDTDAYPLFLKFTDDIRGKSYSGSRLQNVKRINRSASFPSVGEDLIQKIQGVAEKITIHKKEFLKNHYDELFYWLRRNV